MGCFSPDVPPPPQQISPGESMRDYLEAASDPVLQERLLGAEQKYRPQYTQLELADIETMALGGDGQMGLFDLLEEQSRRGGELQRSEQQLQRGADIEALRSMGPQAVEAYREADPYSARLADLSQRQAEKLYRESEGELSPERRRMAEQSARMGSLARGRELDSSSLADELLGREQVRSQLRGEARQAGNLAYTQARGLYGDIGSTILNRPTQSLGIGAGALQQAQLGAYGPMGPQLFDPNAGINLGLQQQANMASYGGAIAQANATTNAGVMGLIGKTVGTIPAFFTGGA